MNRTEPIDGPSGPIHRGRNETTMSRRSDTTSSHGGGSGPLRTSYRTFGVVGRKNTYADPPLRTCVATDPAARKRTVYYLMGGIALLTALGVGVDLYLGSYLLTPIALTVSILALVAAYVTFSRRQRRRNR